MDDIGFWNVDDHDIYDADHSSDEKYKKKEREVVLKEMENTIWFRTIGLYPVNLPEMEYFIEQLDVLDSFKEFDIDNVLNLGPKRLDALFLILKLINLEVVSFCEYIIHTNFIKPFEKLVQENIEQLSLNSIGNDNTSPTILHKNSKAFNAFIEEYYCDMADFIIRLLTTYQKDIKENKDSLFFITNKLIEYLHRTLNNKYYTRILSKLEIVFGKNFFQDNYQTFQEITKNFINDTITREEPFLVLIRLFVTKFLDDSVSDDDLLIFIGDNTTIPSLIDYPSDAIDDFYLIMMDELSPVEISKQKNSWISQYNNFLFESEHKIESKKYAFWLKTDNISTYDYAYWTKKRKDDAVIRAEKIGMVLYPENEFNYILHPFVLHNFVKNTNELVDMIADIMDKNRYAPGIFNKYDDTDLDTSYMLTALSNDINETYDDFLVDIKKSHALPNDYSIEFILRLVSRILNVMIHFYDNNMVLTTIDNSIYLIYPKPIIICQISYFHYFLLHSKNSTFEPVGESNPDLQPKLNPTQMNIVNNKPKPKKKKIIEV